MALQVTGRARLKVVLIVVVTITGLSIFLWSTAKRSALEPATPNLNSQETAGDAQDRQTGLPAPSPTQPIHSFSPSPVESPAAPQSEPGFALQANQAAANATLASNYVGTLRLIIPVVGVRPDQLRDTFTDARSEGRAHDAIDIPAPAGTPVVAAVDGEIIKLFQSERGGTTIYQLSADKKLLFYYAHLQGYADGLAPGKFVRQGEIIGYVGDTGNAGTGNYHLHFSISVIADPKRYWEGANINPYPVLRK